MATESIDIRISETGGRTVRRSLEDIAGAASRGYDAVGLLKRALSSLAIGFTLQQSIMTVATFSKEMATLRAISGATGEELQALREEAKRLGAETSFSATEAAQAATELARTGFTTAQVLQSLGATLQLAIAGGAGLAQSAEIVGSALKGMRLEADQAQRVVDVLAEAANRSAAGVVDLGEALSYVAPVASGLNVSLETTVAAISALSDAGLKGSTAGTGLRRVLSELESPSTTAQKVLRQVGLTVNDVRVSSVGLVTALERLAGAGIDTGLALELFGDRGGPAFEVLSSNIEKLKEFERGLMDSGGAAQQMADIMRDNLLGAMDELSSSVEGLILGIGDLGAESLLTRGVLLAADAVSFLTRNLEEVADVAKAMAGVLFVAFGGVTRAVGLAALAVRTLTAAIAANPVGAIAVAVTAAASAVKLFGDRVKVTSDEVVTLKDVASAVFDELRDGALAAARFVSDGLGRAFDAVQETLGDLVPSLDDALSAVRTFVNRSIGLFVGLHRAAFVVFERLARVVIDTVGAIPNTVRATAEGIAGYFTAALQGVGGLFERMFGVDIPTVMRGAANFAREVFGEVAGWASRLFGLVSSTARDVATTLTDQLNIELPELRLPEIEIPEIEFPEIRLPQTVKDFATDVREAFLEGFEADYVGAAMDSLAPMFDRIMERARQNAEERLALERRTQDELAALSGGVPGGEPVDVVGGVDAVAFRQAKIALDDLRESTFASAAAAKALADAKTVLDEAVLRNAATAEEAAAIEAVITAQLRDQLDPLAAVSRQLEEQTELMRMSSEERERAVRLRQIEQQLIAQGILLTDQERAALEAQIATLQQATEAAELRDRMEQQRVDLDEFFIGINQAAQRTLSRAIADPLGEGLKDLPDQFAATLRQMAAEFLVSQLFQLLSGIGAGQGGFRGAIGAFFGGGRLPGFANGGSFTVGGSGGADSKLVSFWATPGERVDVRTPQQQREEARRDRGGFTQHNTFILPPGSDGPSLGRTQAQVSSAAYRAAQRAFRRNM